jgi:hypothetical protein
MKTNGARRSIFEQLSHGGRGLAIGHSPTNEAAVYQLTIVEQDLL